MLPTLVGTSDRLNGEVIPKFPSGFELANTIRQHPRFEKTAIIFISAVHVSDMDRLTGFEQGAVDYISVPIVPRLLRARVRVFVELYRKTRELERLNGELRRVSSHLIRMQDDEHRRHESTVSAGITIPVVGSTTGRQQKQQKNQNHDQSSLVIRSPTLNLLWHNPTL